jgi:hypothetical protein
MGSRVLGNSRELAYHVQNPGINPQYLRKKEEEELKYITLSY